MTEAKPEPVCVVCARSAGQTELVRAGTVRESVAALVRADYPRWSQQSFICREDLDRYRTRYVQQVLEQNIGELSEVDRDFIRRMDEEELLSRNINAEFETKLSLGDRVADRVAALGGSWRFIIIFGFVLAAWVAVNSVALLHRPFDPYPYILLNLVLSCLAAIQAPVIMMSQNRQDTKDRLRSEHDYKINLKAEIEIRSLHEKIDHLVFKQWQRLLEIQEIQLEIIQELGNRERGRPA